MTEQQTVTAPGPWRRLWLSNWAVPAIMFSVLAVIFAVGGANWWHQAHPDRSIHILLSMPPGSDNHAGQSVVVADGAGNVIGTAALTYTVGGEDGESTNYDVDVAVADTDYYQLTIPGMRGVRMLTRQQLEDHSWFLGLDPACPNGEIARAGCTD